VGTWAAGRGARVASWAGRVKPKGRREVWAVGVLGPGKRKRKGPLGRRGWVGFSHGLGCFGFGLALGFGLLFYFYFLSLFHF
jgi:hypothetical protein